MLCVFSTAATEHIVMYGISSDNGEEKRRRDDEKKRWADERERRYEGG